MPRDLHSGDVIADINYFPALGTPIPRSAWRPRYLDHHDEFNIHGFQFLQLPQNKTRITRDDDEETVKREYYPELEAIAKTM
jgi:hypothetical protein